MSGLRKPTTREMSDKHEGFVSDLLAFRQTRGSGNQFRDQTDGRHNPRDRHFAFAFDGKSTLGDSISISKSTWDKLVEQAHGLRPMLPLRYYSDYRLSVYRDLAVVDLHDLYEVLEAAERGQS